MLALMIIGVTMVSCVHFPETQSGQTETFNPDLDKDQYLQAIEMQNQVAGSGAQKSKRARAYFNIALLYLSYKNPDQDYRTAHHYVEKAIRTDSSLAEQFEVQNLRRTLFDFRYMSKKITESNEQIRADQKTIATLKKEIKVRDKSVDKMREANARLIKMNTDLKHSIDRLKRLDIEIEKKRKSLR